MVEILGFKEKTEKSYIVSCQKCGCVIRLGESDIEKNSYQYNEYAFSSIKCPNCGNTIHFDKTNKCYADVTETLEKIHFKK